MFLPGIKDVDLLQQLISIGPLSQTPACPSGPESYGNAESFISRFRAIACIRRLHR